MQFLARRRPPSWALLVVAVLFAALAGYGLATGEAVMPGGRGSPTRHFLHRDQPAEFLRMICFQAGFASLLFVLAFARVAPVEDGFRDLRRNLKARQENDRAPAPAWSYLFLAAFIGLVVWIGWKVMYSE